MERLLGLLILTACSSSGGGADGGGDCSNLPKVQGAQQQCCPSYGADACAPMLFCLAVEGRTIPTCNPEHSIADAMPCTGDVQCISGGCNTMAGKCQYTQGAACDATIGCAAPAGAVAVCAGTVTSGPLDGYVDPAHLLCDSSANRPLGSSCGVCRSTADCTTANAQCMAGRCIDSRCHLQ